MDEVSAVAFIAEVPQTFGDLWLGKVDDQWPIYLFTDESSVIYWMDNAPVRETRRAWRVANYVLGPELELVKPEPTLREVRRG